MKHLAAVLALLAAQPAAAQQQQRFVPFTIDQASYDGLMAYLGDVPAKYANPVIRRLEQMEMEAFARSQAQAAREAAEKEKQGSERP